MTIVGANGQAYVPTTETRFDPRLLQVLMQLEDLLQQNGLGLFCRRCQSLGLHDGVVGESVPGYYVLRCGCAKRVFDTLVGQEKVTLS